MIIKGVLTIITFILTTTLLSFSQEIKSHQIIDKEACDNWNYLQEISNKSGLISNDGKYIAYQYGSKTFRSYIVVKEIEGPFKMEFPSTGAPAAITEDSKKLIALLPGDSLLIQTLGKKDCQYLQGVKSYNLPNNGNGRWLSYETSDNEKKVTIKDLFSNSERSYSRIEESWFNDVGTVLLMKSSFGLVWLDLTTGKEELIPESIGSGNIAFDAVGNKIAFITNGQNGYQLKLFKPGERGVDVIVKSESKGIENGFKLCDGQLNFSKNGERVFFSLNKLENENPRPDSDVITNKVNIWSYKDIILQERQFSILNELKNKQYSALVDIKTKSIIQLEDGNYELVSFQSRGNEFALIATKSFSDEFYWNKQRKELFIISYIDGKKKKLDESSYPGIAATSIKLSPDEKFVIWFDCARENYFSYEIKSEQIRNISNDINESLTSTNQRGESAKSINWIIPYGFAAWTKGNSLLIYTRNDIWKIDLLDSNPPVNITNNYGKSNDIKFRLLMNNETPTSIDKGYLLWAFNNRNKQNGFWKVSTNKRKDPIRLIMDDHAYFFVPLAPLVSENGSENPASFTPIKAKKCNVFAVRIMSSTEAPNLFITKNFKSYLPISDIQPKKSYNWLTTELITWTLPDGSMSDGLLHKPEDFDSLKKYPIIFNYYERRSECLNIFRTPAVSGHNINIPWYVSRGYLVFEPDFYYQRGKTAESVINAITSAANYLQKLPYVDSKHMGVEGQSHGGYETNIIAAGTNIFAAACEMAGYTNIISEYGSLRPGGMNNQIASDMLQRNLGVFPWEHPEVFIENSPVFNIGRMTTPLLMIHNKGDRGVSFSHALELFLGMRRANKKVWLLVYDDEDHSIHNEDNKLDYTIRMQQFFDYYLKQTPSPIWMTQGISAKDKGLKSGLELDTTITIP